MAYTAWARLAYVFPHLLDGVALDLGSRHRAVAYWFSGAGLAGKTSSTYPPASYLLLWPLLGWPSLQAASALWAALCALALVWLMLLCLRDRAIASLSARWFGAMAMGAFTATSAVIWLGQLVILQLAAITLAMLLLHPKTGEPVGWKRELGAGALLLFALVKPSVGVPFLCLVLWSPTRLRVGVGVIAGYGVLTLAALAMQRDSLGELTMWAETVGRNSPQLNEGYANLRVWLAALGLKWFSHPAAALALAWLGVWTHRHSHADRVTLLGVTALVARLWTYHNSYDDFLLVVPMLALLRIAGRPDTNATDAARSDALEARQFLVTLVLLLLLPPNWLFEQSLTGMAARGLTGLVMVLTLWFLVRLAGREPLAPAQKPRSSDKILAARIGD